MESLYTAYLDGKLVLSADGEWIHEGKRFENERLIALFFRSILWDGAERRYVLKIGRGKATFTCEDTAFFVLALDSGRADGWLATLSDGGNEPLDPATLRVGSENQIYCTVKGGHRARLSRAAHQTLLEHATGDDSVEIAGRIHRIPPA